MRSLLITVALAATAIVLAGCRNKKPEPVPGPQSGLVQRTMPARGGLHAGAVDESAARHCPRQRRSGTGETSWLQGTLEEGLSRHGTVESHTLFRY